MHIGLNAHLLSSSKSYRAAGINSYIYSLLQHLPDAVGEHKLTVFLGDKEASGSLPGVETRVSTLPTRNPAIRILWEQLVQPVQLLREGIDILHSLAFVQPVALHCAGVVTVYDLSFVLFPQRLPSWRRTYLRWGTAFSVQRAGRVIAISASTKRDVVRVLDVSEGKVDVVPCGVDEGFRPVESPAQLDALRTKRHLPPKMILFVGTVEPRKNLTTLLRSYALLKRRFAPPPLVLAGPRGWGHEETISLVEELGLKNEVIFPGYIPREELPLWYNAATLFVYPSLYEGFGLPPLEAMACGTPVIASNTSALPEVVSDAGLLVEPTDAEEMAEAMHLLLSDGDLRDTLRRKGLQRAESFSWQRAAVETARVYDRALSGSATRE
jgi:glycosyltransferase involved in cell wall biosynthesis